MNRMLLTRLMLLLSAVALTVLLAGCERDAISAETPQSAQANQTDDALALVHQFADQQEAALLGQPGWLHIITQSAHDINVESWYHIDETGIFDQAMKLTRSSDGTLLEKSLFVDGKWHVQLPQTTDEAHETAAPSDVTMVIMLPTSTAARSLSRIATRSTAPFQVIMEEDFTHITATESYPEPIGDETIIGSRATFVFDNQTGALISHEQHPILESGKPTTVEKWTYSAEFMSTLPQAIADQFPINH